MSLAPIFYGFDFEDKATFNENINLECSVKNLPVERDRNDDLAFDT